MLKWEWRLSIEETERTTTLTLARPPLSLRYPYTCVRRIKTTVAAIARG